LCFGRFKHAPKKLLLVLKNQYQADQGKVKNDYKMQLGKNSHETTQEVITRFLSKELPKTKSIFRTVVIDEGR